MKFLSPSTRPPDGAGQGIRGIRDPRWFVVLALYAISTFVMVRDPWYGTEMFVWKQGTIVLLLSFCIVATLAWETLSLGPPSGANLVLQILLIIPFSLFLGRVIGPPSEWQEPAARKALSIFSNIGLLKFTEFIPDWIRTLFRRPLLLMMILLVPIALSQKTQRRRVALLITFLLIPFLAIFADSPGAGVLWFVLGSVCMFAGVSLHYCDYKQIIRERNALYRMRLIDDANEWTACLRIVRQALDDGFVREENVESIVARVYGHARGEIPLLARTMVSRLVREHRVLEVEGNAFGMFLVPAVALDRASNLLAEVAIWPRRMFFAVLAVFWLILPIDVIPDAIPVVGALDDVAVVLLGSAQWAQGRRSRRSSLLRTLNEEE